MKMTIPRGSASVNVEVDRRAHYINLLSAIPHGVLRRITCGKCRGYSVITPFLAEKYGLEIGGPSTIFSKHRLIPVYDRCRLIDNCNFSRRTIWDDVTDHKCFESRLGSQFVAEACDLSMIPDQTYDFVLASHVLEHIANPLGALQEWKRVLSRQGVLLIVLPDKRATFDHLRPYTSIEHIESDFERNTPEDDLTHVDEVLGLHDLTLDPGAGSWEQFRERCRHNASVRAVHHHVFKPEVLVSLFTRLGMQVLNLAVERRFHIIVFARKSDPAEHEQVRLQNLYLLREDADWRTHDPFRRKTATVTFRLSWTLRTGNR
jgi:SAM-dependent methyltransferase